MSEAYKYGRNTISGGYDIISDIRDDLAIPNTLLSAEIESAFPGKVFSIKIKGSVVSIVFELVLDDAEEIILDEIIEDHKAYFTSLIENLEASIIYFKVKLANLTDSILEKSVDNCPITAPRSSDGYIMLKYNDNDIPAEFIKGFYSPYSLAEVQIELQEEEWNTDEPVIMDNTYKMSFDGVDEHINFGDNFNYNYNDAFTYSIWVNPQNIAQQRCIFSKCNSAVKGFIVYHDASGNPFLQLRGATLRNIVIADIAFIPGTLNSLIITYSGSANTSGINVYINGVKGTNTTADSIGQLLYGQDFFLGSRNGAFYFNGSLDEFSVFNKELSEVEATELYNLGDPNNVEDHSASSNLKHYYRLGDNDTSPTVTDNVGIVDGTMINMNADNITEV